jgi:hypothetical protein
VPAGEASRRLAMPLSNSLILPSLTLAARCPSKYAFGPRVHSPRGANSPREFTERSQEVIENKGDRFIANRKSQEVFENK